MGEVEFMRRAIALSRQGLELGGGPFGSVIVRNERIIGEGINRVVLDADPTAHAEVVAIRRACQAVGSHALERATVYTSCEPCPMCLGALWWARVREIVYANGRQDAAAIGFDDAAIYAEIARPLVSRQLPMRRLMADEAWVVFDQWRAKPDRVPY